MTSWMSWSTACDPSPTASLASLPAAALMGSPKSEAGHWANQRQQEAMLIQDFYLDGKKLEAMAAVPDKLVDEVAIVGPRDRVKGELERWKDAGKRKHVSSMLIAGASKETMQLLAEEML